MKQTVVISKKTDERGYFYRAIHLEDDGSLVIEGQDIGSGVEDIFGGGDNEYEFFRTIRPPAVAELERLSGISHTGLLENLREHFGTTSALEEYLEEHGIPSGFWSRVGD
jgi:hypothetical protein